MIYLFKPHALHASSYLLKSRATYLFHVMKNWGIKKSCLWSEGTKQPSNGILFSVWCFTPTPMWICLEIDDRTRRTISFEAASVRGFGTLNSRLPWWVNREPSSPSVTFLLPQRKSTALHFHLCTQKFILLFLYTLTYHISTLISYLHFHLKSTVLYIYIMIIPDFFYCECFCAAPHPIQ